MRTRDAYDLFYLFRNLGSGVCDVADELRPFLSAPSATKAPEYLRSDLEVPIQSDQCASPGFFSENRILKFKRMWSA